MLLDRGIDLSYETIRRWAKKFGPDYAHRLKRKSLVDTTFGISMKSNVFIRRHEGDAIGFPFAR
jgi:hypothetical protein